ncbi:MULTISPECIES: hypothetical protein [unclassified Rhizobium]
MTFSPSAEDVFADGPSSNPLQPSKLEIRRLLSGYESVMNAFVGGGSDIAYTLSQLNMFLTPGPFSSAWVVQDPVAANNGIYQKSGSPGTGFWQRIADLPYSFIVATDAGAGTANAILATSSIAISTSSLVVLNISRDNTGSPVTVQFNGASILTIKSNSGNDILPGGLTAGMQVLGRIVESTFRIVTDQIGAAILAAAESAAADSAASAEEASDYADFARNNWVVNGPFTGTGVQADYALTINPGSANNMFVIVGGVGQLVSDIAFSLVSSGGVSYIRINVPLGVKFEVRTSNAIPIGTPPDGSIIETKHATGGVSTRALADKAGTYAKIQDVSATFRLLGRKSAGAGVIEELTATDLLAFLPAGSVIGSPPAAVYAANADITQANSIPLDDTLPQITEGVEILTVTYTPLLSTSRLRIRFSGFVTSTNAPANVAWAIFNGGANAIRAEPVTVPAANYSCPVSGEVEYSPGVTTPQTISVRAGPAGTGSTQAIRFNGSTVGRLFGGSSAATLTVEEIKV